MVKNCNFTFLDDSELGPSLDVSGRIGCHALVDSGIELHQTQDLEVRATDDLD